MGNCWSFQSNPKFFLDGIVLAHNHYRAHHLSPPLELDKQRCLEASMHANLCAYHRQAIQHRGGVKGSHNIYVGTGPLSTLSPVTAVNEWYGQVKFHVFDRPYTANGKSHEFAKMIWKSGRKLGIGFARTTHKLKSARMNFLVCLYDPIDEGASLENVLRSINSIPAFKLTETPYDHTKPYFPVQMDLSTSWGIVDTQLTTVPEWIPYFRDNRGALNALANFLAQPRSSKSNDPGMEPLPSSESEQGSKPSQQGRSIPIPMDSTEEVKEMGTGRAIDITQPTEGEEVKEMVTGRAMGITQSTEGEQSIDDNKNLNTGPEEGAKEDEIKPSVEEPEKSRVRRDLRKRNSSPQFEYRRYYINY